MLTVDMKRRLAAAAMFGLPIGLVWGTATLIGGPSSAQADNGPAIAAANLTATANAPATDALSPELEAAVDRIGALQGTPFGDTPLYHAARGVTPTPVEVNDPTPVPVNTAAPSFTVKMIMATARGNIALIDGKSYREGQMLKGTTWKIIGIDADNRTVTIEHEDTGRVRTKSVD